MYFLKSKFDIVYKEKKYKIGEIIQSDNIVEINALTRMGCIFVDEPILEKKVEVKESKAIINQDLSSDESTEEVKYNKRKKVRKDVTVQNLEQTEIQE